MDYEAIAKRLQAARKNAGLSQEEAAALLGVSRQTLSKWENGDGLPDSEKLVAISRVYEISIDALLLGKAPDIDMASYEKLIEKAATEECTYGETIEAVLAQSSKEPSALDRIIQWFPYPILCLIVFLVIGFAYDAWRVCWSVFITIPVYYSTLHSLKYKKTVMVVYPLVATVAYLLVGFLVPKGWEYGWLLLFSIPLFSSIVRAVEKHNFFYLSYSTVVAMVYLFLGMWKGWWHPHWILFLTVPLYYGIAKIVQHNK
ncbi:MAG: helix-turn-helix domain-containing protein [Clostridiales bacterium]|nr:helix-turn-helix domain-containing protein [Clostridiales bacterium]